MLSRFTGKPVCKVYLNDIRGVVEANSFVKFRPRQMIAITKYMISLERKNRLRSRFLTPFSPLKESMVLY